MATKSAHTNQWHVRALPPPKLQTSTWQAMNVIALLVVVMALLQLVDFNEFAADLKGLGISGGSFWPGVVAGAELWAIASLLRLPLSRAFRLASSALLVGVAAFWFLLSISAVVQDNTSRNFGIFGSFADIKADWWMVLFTALLLGASLWAANITKSSQYQSTARVVETKTKTPARKKTAAKRRNKR